jgi:DNA-binding protein H-NS
MTKIEKMSREELQAARESKARELREIERAEAEYEERRLKELKAEFEARLKEEGFAWSDMFGGTKPKKSGGTKSKGEPKYRHPENPDVTWSGRGRQPTWYKEAIENGAKPEDMAI